MTCESVVFLRGLVIAACCCAAAYGQAPAQRQTLAERIAQLSRGWRQDEAKSSEAERANAPPPATHASGPPSHGQPLRNSSAPRAGSVQNRQSRHQGGMTLPGLGGSPLPGDAVAPGRGQPAPAIDVSRENLADSPAVQSNGRFDALRPSDAQGAATARRAGDAVRQSPQRRPAIQIDPERLHRELAGAFPVSESSGPSQPDAKPPAKSLNITPLDENDTDELSATRRPAVNEPATRRDGAVAFGQVEAQGAADHSDLDHSDLDLDQPRTSPRAGTAPITPIPAASSAAAPPRSRRPDGLDELTSAPAGEGNLLVTHQTPVIATDIRGPNQILVGREATYRVRLQNQGRVAAEGIVASIRVPSWAEVVDTAATHGTVQQAGDAEARGVLQWQLARIGPDGAETLDVRLVPRSSRPLELAVSWTHAPVGSRAVVEVQEPKLRLHVSGPEEVLYGKAQVYRMTLTNPGTGMAENVRIDLMPPGGGEDAVTSHEVGDLAAGASQSIDVELTAREAGKLFVKALASAEGGLKSEAAKEIFCRKPELEVDWRGPENKYTGTDATYFIRVRNPGTATAEDVTVTATLPDGAELVTASEGQVFDAAQREVAWRVGSLAPGDDYYMELKCLVHAPGRNELTISAATAAGDLSDSRVAETNVIALADLKLEVLDPSGPVAVGDEAVYEIRVRNRGAGPAQEVEVAALFSEGVEPDTVDGAMYSVADGRVTFRAIDELAPGKEIVLRIRAHATQPGTHVFRAEVLCREQDIRLASEESTRFYADDVFDANGAAERRSAGFRDGADDEAP